MSNLGEEEGHELGRHAAAVDDGVEALDGPRDLELSRQTHSQTGEDVANLKGGREPVPGCVGHRDVKGVVIESDDVIEVPTHDLRGNRSGRDLEVAGLRDVAREDRVLNQPRIFHDRDHAFLAKLLVDREADDVERRDHVVVVRVQRLDIERQHVMGVGHGNGGKPLPRAEIGLEPLVEPGVIPSHDHRAHIEQLLERRVGLPHPKPDRVPRGVAEGLHQLVAAVVLSVDPAAANPEVLGKVVGDEVGGALDGLERGRAEGDGLERTLDPPKQ